jgi:Neurotransmitter-gated ion-channel ligand binding domain
MLARSAKRNDVRPPFGRYFTVLSLLIVLMLFACEASVLASTETNAPTEASPTVVRVGLVLRNLVAIDELKESWQVTGLIVGRWNDRRLRYRLARQRYLYRELPANRWKPEFEFTNEDEPSNFHFQDFYAKPDGTVVYTQSFSATLSANLDLRRFPFDSQTLPVVVQASGNDLDRTILKPDVRDSAALPNPTYGVAQWAPFSLSARSRPVVGSASRANDVEFSLEVRRNPRPYILKFIVPLLLLVIISWITFWLSPQEFKTKDQLQSAVATLLIIVAFDITASTFLPKTDYTTYLDALDFTCFIWVIIAIGTIVGIHVLQLRHSEQRALFVRRLAGLVLPLTFVIAQAGLLFKFHIAG